MTVSVHEAKTQLSKLLDLLENGEEVVIERHGRAVARLVPANATAKPKLGTMRGEMRLKRGWNRPLSAKEADAFWEGRW